ncbi:MAG: PD40 domain-containing protein [Deltaproteobacteria bacterium]|nr:PD40 domain-containing protein [Deltaproteobacteria bacterium]
MGVSEGARKRLSWICWSILAGACCAPLIARAAIFDPGKSYRTITTPHFAIHYAAELEPVARKVAAITEEVHGRLSPRYRWTPWGRTQLLLTDSYDTANASASVLPYNWLLIRVTAPDPESPLATYDDWLRTLIMHEYTHILHMDQVGGIMRVPRLLLGKTVAPNGILPGWMREGLATYEETRQTTGGRGRASFSEMMLRTAALNDRWPKIDQADGLGWRWPGSHSQYIYGVKFLEWLGTTYGDQTVLDYQRRVGRSPFFFMNNHHAKKIWGKSFYKLWQEWQTDVTQRSRADRERLAEEGLTELEPVSSVGASLSAPAFSADGTRMAYAVADYHGPAQIRVRNLTDGSEEVVKKHQGATQISFAPKGDKLVYSASGVHNKFYYLSDLYLLDLANKQTERLTTGRRALDPDISPDGKRLVYVINDAGTQQLAVMNLDDRQEKIVPISDPRETQYSHPRWSPSGKMLAVSSWRPGGYRDLFLVKPNGRVIRQVTDDRALDLSPAWSRNGRSLYFSSDRTGISNIYRYDLRSGEIAQVTNVVTGVFQPALAPDGNSIVVQHYTGEGYDLRRLSLLPGSSLRGAQPREGAPPSQLGQIVHQRSVLPVSAGHRLHLTPPPPSVGLPHPRPRSGTALAQGEAGLPSKKYNPFTGSLFLPRFISPGVVALDNGVLISAATGGADPLRWHNWLGGITYRTDAAHVGYFGTYIYNRYTPTFDLGLTNYAVSGPRLTDITTGNTFIVYEKRLRGSLGASVPWKQHRFSLQYFLEDRDNITAMDAATRAFFNYDMFGGFNAVYRWGTAARYAASISPERGQRLRLHFGLTDRIFGSSETNEQQVFTGDYRAFLNLPWRHHVLATRLSGGITWGDPFLIGSFGLGGALGEGTLAGTENFYYFPLRGLPLSSFTGSRATLASVEYRVPLASPQRGLGTWPVFWNNLHAAVFADAGNVWNAGQGTGKFLVGQFLVGTGVEVRGDFLLGHGLPVSGRLGYGIIVANRDRLGTLADPLLKSSAKYGTLVLQLGTSF